MEGVTMQKNKTTDWEKRFDEKFYSKKIFDRWGRKELTYKYVDGSDIKDFIRVEFSQERKKWEEDLREKIENLLHVYGSEGNNYSLACKDILELLEPKEECE